MLSSAASRAVKKWQAMRCVHNGGRKAVQTESVDHDDQVELKLRVDVGRLQGTAKYSGLPVYLITDAASAAQFSPSCERTQEARVMIMKKW
jgi:hypothetical protein